MTPSEAVAAAKTAAPDLSSIARDLSEVKTLVQTLLRAQSAFSDQLDDLQNKVDEINLPVGDGFERSYES